MLDSDKIFRAIERICGKSIVCFHDEANCYAFKVWATGEWMTVNRGLVHDFAGI
jgi:hypothetical protein